MDYGCGRDAKKPGEAGRYIQDDPRKYPDKENMGPFGQCSHLTITQLCISPATATSKPLCNQSAAASCFCICTCELSCKLQQR